jgi:hypothetical protein
MLVYGKQRLFYDLTRIETAKAPAILRLDSKMIKYGGVKLPNLLVATHSCGATDPRDKIFALLSLAEEIDRRAIQVDYTISHEELFAITTNYCINHYGPSILSLIQDRTSSQSSWIPNFISTAELIPLLYTKDKFSFANIRSVTLSQDQMVLKANGKPLDFVKHIQQRTDQTFARLEECSRYFENPAPLEQVVDCYCQMLGIDVNLGETPLSFLLHKPKQEQIWESLQPGVDPTDLTSIDLLAPYWERKGDYFPYCTFYLTSFRDLAFQFLQGRQTHNWSMSKRHENRRSYMED